MATNLSQVTNIRWSAEQMDKPRSKELWKIPVLSFPDKPANWSAFHRMKEGCAMKPVNTSVTAKQASNTFALVWSLGVFFTAMTTSTLSTNVKGQIILLITKVMSEPVSWLSMFDAVKILLCCLLSTHSELDRLIREISDPKPKLRL